MTDPCPCGAGLPLAKCCGRLHARFAADGALTAPTAEALMRSRYAAFALLGEAGADDDGTQGTDGASGPGGTGPGRTGPGHPGPDHAGPDHAGPDRARAMAAYLAATWAPEHRPAVEDLLPEAGERAPRFTRLAVTDVRDGGPFQDRGTVEFTALGHGEEGRFRLRERSRFRREDGAWLYVDGDVD